MKRLLDIGLIVGAIVFVALTLRWCTVHAHDCEVTTRFHDESQIEASELAALRSRLKTELPDAYIRTVAARTIVVEDYHGSNPHIKFEPSPAETSRASYIIRADWRDVYQTYHPGDHTGTVTFFLNNMAYSVPQCAPM